MCSFLDGKRCAIPNVTGGMTLEDVGKAINGKLPALSSACEVEDAEDCFVFSYRGKIFEDLSLTLECCELNELSILTFLRFVRLL